MGYYIGTDWPVMRQFGLLCADGTTGGDVTEIAVWSDSTDRPDYLGLNAAGHTEEQGFGSPHSGGLFSSVFGDGSTRTISNNADLRILDELGKRADGTTSAALLGMSGVGMFLRRRRRS